MDRGHSAAIMALVLPKWGLLQAWLTLDTRSGVARMYALLKKCPPEFKREVGAAACRGDLTRTPTAATQQEGEGAGPTGFIYRLWRLSDCWAYPQCSSV